MEPVVETSSRHKYLSLLDSRKLAGFYDNYADEIEWYSANYPTSPCYFYFGVFNLGKQYTISGKGNNQKTAWQSCVGEAAELISSIYWGNEKLYRQKDIPLDREVLNLKTLYHLSPSQENIIKSHQEDPEFKSYKGTEYWIKAEDFLRNENVYIPGELCFLNFQEQEYPELITPDSNGSAAGDTYYQAIVSGFLEAVERDATAIWWYCRHSCFSIDPTLVEDENLTKLIAWCTNRSRNTHILSIQTDLPIPVYVSVSYNSPGNAIFLGAAADFNPGTAITKAINEMLAQELSAQMFMSRNRPKSNADLTLYKKLKEWISNVKLDNQPQISPKGVSKKVIKNNEPRDLNRIERIKEICDAFNLRLYICDLTQKSVGVPVVKVIVPELCSLKPHFGPGRLYDVPRKLKWQNISNKERDMNRYPLLV